MSQIKLKHSGGNGVIIAAPSSNPASDRTLTLPGDADGTIVSKDSSNNLTGIASINGGSIGTKNAIINGAMRVSQRSQSVSVSNSVKGYQTLDRFEYNIHGTITHVMTMEKSTDSPDGFSNSLKFSTTTADASLTTDQSHYLSHEIEGQDLQHLAYGTSSAKSFTLSFYVKGTITGTYCVWFYSFDTGKACTHTYTINSANTWERKTITVDGDTASAIANDNGSGLMVRWILGTGPSYSSGSASTTWTTNSLTAENRYVGQTANIAATTSDNWAITGVQLEAGSTANEFVHESYADTFLKCQRYYHVLYDNTLHQGTYWRTGYYYNSTTINLIMRMNPEMRATPSLDCTSVTNLYRLYRDGSYDGLDDFTLSHSSKNSVRLYNSSDASGTAGQAGGFYVSSGSAAIIALNAEL